MKGIASDSRTMFEQILSSLEGIRADTRKMESPGQKASSQGKESSFAKELEKGLKEVNGSQVMADRMAMELTSGKTGNIHETMLASTQAELSFNLMVQVRNKALEAYNEIMRMPV